MKKHIPKILCIEYFGNVRPDQSHPYNQQLSFMLEGFDREYVNQGGKLGSNEHQEDRFGFAKFTSEVLLEDAKTQQGEIEGLVSEVSYQCHHLKRNIVVKQYTEFSYQLTHVLDAFDDPNPN